MKRPKIVLFITETAIQDRDVSAKIKYFLFQTEEALDKNWKPSGEDLQI